MSEPMKVDDLQYDWPKNILAYESRVFLGLSLQELMFVALPAVVVMTFLGNLILGVIIAVVSFLLVRKFEGLGDRNLIAYALARVQHLAAERTPGQPAADPPRRAAGRFRHHRSGWRGSHADRRLTDEYRATGLLRYRHGFALAASGDFGFLGRPATHCAGLTQRPAADGDRRAETRGHHGRVPDTPRWMNANSPRGARLPDAVSRISGPGGGRGALYAPVPGGQYPAR